MTEAKGSEGVQVQLIPDGGNPRCEYAVRKKDGAFVIYPFSEDGDPNYKFRLDVGLFNSSARSVPTPFIIEWGDREYARFRGYLLLAVGESWAKLPAQTVGTRAIATLDVPPGESRLCMHPPYDYGRLVDFLGGLPKDPFSIRSAGRSLHGRDILVAEAGPPGERPIFIQVRTHPYESIGSYFADGMMSWLAGRGADPGGIDLTAEEVLASRRVVFVPMPNPDGVADGLCKRTLGGMDVNTAAASEEPEGVALKALVDEVKPIMTVDWHGFMHDRDGYGSNDIVKARAFHDLCMRRANLFNKPCSVREATTTEGGMGNLGQYSTAKYGSTRLGGSWSWYGRDAAHLRAMGVVMLKAMATVCGSA